MALAVAIGAFGAHGLKPHLDTYGLDIYKTANFYHFIHGIALFITLILGKNLSNKSLNGIFYIFILGIVLFSGSLYVLSLKSILSSIPGWFGAITPLGGLCFIAGWIGLGLNFFQKKID